MSQTFNGIDNVMGVMQAMGCDVAWSFPDEVPHYETPTQVTAHSDGFSLCNIFYRNLTFDKRDEIVRNIIDYQITTTEWVYYIQNATLNYNEGGETGQMTTWAVNGGIVYRNASGALINVVLGRQFCTGEGWTERTYQGGTVTENRYPSSFMDFPFQPYVGVTQQAVNVVSINPAIWELNMDSWIFKSLQDAKDYLNGNHDIQPINPPKPVPPEEEGHYYINSRVVSRGTINQFQFHTKVDIFCKPHEIVTGYEIPNKATKNARFITKSTNLKKIVVTTYNEQGTQTGQQVYTNVQGDFWHSGNYITTIDGVTQAPFDVEVGPTLYHVDCTTNITFYHNREDAVDGLDDDNNKPNKNNPTGEDEDETINPTPLIDVVGSNIHILNASQMTTVVNELFTDDDTLFEQLKKGLAMYGDNPLDVLINAYICPFDLSPYCTSATQNSINFGNYVMSVNNKQVNSNNKLLTVANVSIQGTYNDWRDYDTKYYLHLPYCGIQLLDAERYLYKNLTVKMAVDVRTGNIKYYCFANNKIVDTYEGSCGINFALLGSNASEKAWEMINGAITIGSSIVSVASGMPSVGLAGQIVNEVGTAMNNAPKHLSGNQSPATSIFDVNYVYLIIETPTFVQPTNLKNTYGVPCNNVTTIGIYSGYVEAVNVQLKTTATDRERQEILTALEKGVIV